MAMATGGDVVLQMLRELRDLQQQVQVNNGRMEDRLTQTQRNVETLRQNVAMLVENVSGLVEGFRGTKELHEQYLNQLGRTVNMLADQQQQDRDRLDTHEGRIGALEQA
ncbi:MAG TPA: hypothetical protein VE153_17545 [Myxococcus sp.]|nr:hypothetical protein [Myxococcus sp.]